MRHFGIARVATLGYTARVLRVSGLGRVAVLVLAGILLGSPTCYAVLFKSTGATNYNTTAPTGALTNSGWRYQGAWGSFLATPIAPTYFLAAKHVGGTIGQTFTLNGFIYHTLTNFPDANSDLQIWKVAETFPDYALLYTNSNEAGKHCVVFGRGTERGPAVIISGVTNGWAWGPGDGIERWGENDVTSIYTDAMVGALLRCTFDRGGASNECQLSTGDSSGGMFIQDNSNVWRLAGMNYSVDNPFISTNGVTGSGFNAAMLDYGGVYIGGDGDWQPITNQTADIPSTFYCSRVSSHLAWINSVIDLEPGIDLEITSIGVVLTNVLVNFTTGSGKVYRVDWRADFTMGAWATLTNGIVGTGGIMTVTNVGAATQPKRFYRLLLVP